MIKPESILILGILFFSQFSLAGNAEQEAAQLLDVMQLEKTLDKSITRMLEIQIKQNPNLEPFKDVMLSFFAKHMSYKSMKSDMIEIYADAFSEKELREIIAFYQTPTGKKTIEKMPELMSKGAQLGAQRVQQNMPELQQMIKKEAEKLQKK